MLAFGSSFMTDAMIASWSSGTAPVSSGTWASSTFAGTENPLDEGDRWYPLPTYSGFKKMGGLAIGLDSGHNASGVWSITPPAKQYSEVTLGAGGGESAGGPVTPDTQAPTSPGMLTAIAVSGSQINLMWTEAMENVGVTGYLVERCQGAGCTTFVQIMTVTGTTYNDTGLAANTSYSYRVRATDAASNLSAYSNVTSATTLPF